MSLSKLRTRSMGIGAAIVASVLVLGAYGGAAYASDSVSTPDPATSAVATDAKAKVADEGDSKPADGVDDKAQAKDVVSDTSEGEAKVDDTSVDTDSNTNAEDEAKVDNEAANPADSKPIDVVEQAPATEPVSQTVPSVQAPVEQVQAPAAAVAAEPFIISFDPYAEGEQSKIDISVSVSSTQTVGHHVEVRVGGDVVAQTTSAPGSDWVYVYDRYVVKGCTQVVTFDVYDNGAFFKSVPVTPVCPEIKSIEAPAPTQETGSPDVIIPVKEGVTYYNVATDAVVTGTVTLADKDTIKIGAKPSGEVPVVGGPWDFSYTAPVVQPKYVIVLWKVADSDGNGDYWEQNTPKDGSWSLATNSNSLSQLDHLATQCGKYQVDLYWNSKVTAALVAGGTLYGPNNPKEDLAYGAVQGSPYKTFEVTGCNITPPERIPMFLDECGTDHDEVFLPADGENYKFSWKDQRIKGVGLFTVDLVANEGYTIPEGVPTHWKYEFTDKPCLIEIDVPAMPVPVDDCGPGNIHWGPLEGANIVWATNEDGSITAKPAEGYKFKGEAQKVTYPLPADSNTVCPVTPPTTPPVTPTPRPTPEPTHTSAPAALAVTGGSDASLMLSGIGGLVLAVTGGLLLAAVRRRQSQSS